MMETPLMTRNQSMPQLEINDAFKLAGRFLTETNEHLFVTGNAGTGKTSFLRYIRSHCLKNMIVAAPTGIAAINAGGTTLHSLFQLPFGPFIPTEENRLELIRSVKLNKAKLDLIRSMDVLIIDEISMVRADILDAVDTILRSSRRRHDHSFGGVQLLFIGDMAQLPPVARQEEWQLLSAYYDSPYFFDAQVIKFQAPVLIEFTKIYRQKNEDFVELLNKVRNNRLTAPDIEHLNERYLPGFTPDENSGYIILTSHNAKADRINQSKLEALPGTSLSFHAEIEGEFPEYLFPNDEVLYLKAGAQVMFIKNDPVNKAYFNGKIGTVKEITETSILVESENEIISVKPDTWDNTRYSIEPGTSTVRQEIAGTFRQYPLRLAWAITIHKSQGLTFDQVMIDAAHSFTSGQVYVALSRCTSLSGIILLSKIDPQAVQYDMRINSGLSYFNQGKNADRFLQEARKKYVILLVSDMLDLSNIVKYSNFIHSEIRKNEGRFSKGSYEWWTERKDRISEQQKIVGRFIPTLDRLAAEYDTVEENKNLRARINDAIKYFLPVISEQIDLLEKIPVSTELKEPASKVNEFLNEIYLDLQVKKHLLSHCQPEFETGILLGARKSFYPSRTKLSVYNQSEDQEDDGDGDTVLFRRLRKWRDDSATAINVPVYLIGGSEMLREITGLKPANEAQLMTVKGMGRTKVDRYGKEILDIIENYCEEFGIERPDNISIEFSPEKTAKKKRFAKEKEPSVKKEKVPTRLITLELWQEHHDVGKIAVLRALSPATIESHLCELIAEDKLNIEDWIDRETIEQVREIIRKTEQRSLSELKKICPENISFNELKAIRESVKFEGNK